MNNLEKRYYQMFKNDIFTMGIVEYNSSIIHISLCLITWGESRFLPQVHILFILFSLFVQLTQVGEKVPD